MRLLDKFKKKQATDTPTKQTKTESLKTDFKKLKLLVTVIDHQKTEFYLDYLTSLGANFQTAVAAKGTATSDTLYLLGLEESDKNVLFSVIREDAAEEILQGLEEKFQTIRGGKGIAFTIPLTSVIGVAIYRFLSDNRTK